MTRKLLLAAALAASALPAAISTPAAAQDWHHDGDRGGWNRDRDWHGDRDRGWDHDRGGWDRGYRWQGRPYYGGPRYVYPGGFGYRRWGVGAFLPAPLYAPGFYFTDFWRFGLAPPPYGARWVRYGPDLLLVSVRSGRVLDVRYGIFG